jgi:hypothetical protein
MGFHKAAAATKPTALGSMLQSSTYGMTIPMVFGRVLSPVLSIWAAHLRSGGSDKKKKTLFKKSPPTYVENIDFILGHNPIFNVLQIWRNQSDNFPLNFTTYTHNAGLAQTTITIPDADFFAVIGVTFNCELSGTFDDYGAAGSVVYDDAAQEFPMWNCALHGSEITDPNHMRLYPYVYSWRPSDGPTILLPFGTPAGTGRTGFTPTSSITIYYAQLSSLIGNVSPLSKLMLEFESSLGNNASIYTPAPSQQITYPQYAGVGSTSLDLGSAGTIPQLRAELLGSHFFFPSGDAEFADIIEEVFRSGMVQGGEGLSYIQHGCNCNGLPGPVQKDFYSQTIHSVAYMNFYQPNRTGAILLAAGTVYGGGLLMPIADTAGNTWTRFFDAFAGLGNAAATAAYVNGCLASDPINQVTIDGSPGENPAGIILELDPSLDTVDATAGTSGSSGTPTLSITTTGPAYIVAFLLMNIGNSELYETPQHWEDLSPFHGPMVNDNFNSYNQAFGRWVNAAGTYTITIEGTTGSWNVAMIAVSQSSPANYPKALGTIVDIPTMNEVRLQCRAGGLIGSLTMDQQRSASDWLKDLYMAANAAPVWSGFRLKSIPWSEVSAFGNGAVYTAPTADGPLADLKENDLIVDGEKSIVTVDRVSQLDADNIFQIQHLDRDNQYSPSTSSQPESGAIALYGPRKHQPDVLNMIVSPAVARKLLAIQVRRTVYLRNTYKFTMRAPLLQLEAMDLITITDSKLGIDALPVRLTKIVETDAYELECEAEPFVYGANAPNDLPVTTADPYAPDLGVVPGPINVPIIMEPPGRMCLSGKAELWTIVSDTDANYGGSIVYVSADGGSSYTESGITFGNATMGDVTSDWPLDADPDTTNPLSVDLSESSGELNS